MKYLRQEKRSGLSKINILHTCFDERSLKGFSPGLKMIYAADNLPIFIHLKKKDQYVVMDH